MEALALKKEIIEEGAGGDGSDKKKIDNKARKDFADLLEFTALPLPECSKPTDVLIQVSYSDVNPVDVQKLFAAIQKRKQADVRLYATNSEDDLPFIPGYGGTGIVIAVGDNNNNNNNNDSSASSAAVAAKQWLNKTVCFLGNPNRPYGSYSTHVIVDARCVALLPSNVAEREAATIPVAGLTAYESLAKLGLASHVLHQKDKGGLQKVGAAAAAQTTTTSNTNKNNKKISSDPDDKAVSIPSQSLLIVGASGGVGSWSLVFARAWHPSLHIYATATGEEHFNWCQQQLGANTVMNHDEILKFVPADSVPSILCLTEPTPKLWDVLTKVVKSYGTICLVVSGNSIKNMDLSFCFFKCVNVVTQTVFSSIRTNYTTIRPADELAVILNMMSQQQIEAPVSPAIASVVKEDEETKNGETNSNKKVAVSTKFKNVLEDFGILNLLHTGRNCGKLVLTINSGLNLIFVDIKTASLIKIPLLDCIEHGLVTLLSNSKDKNSKNGAGGKKSGGGAAGPQLQQDGWKEAAAQASERDNLVKLLKANNKLGLMPPIEKQWDDYHDVTLQEAEKVKAMWGVQLKKRVMNKEGEEFIFIDPRFELCIGEISRAKMIEKKAITLSKDDEGNEIIKENVTAADERDEVIKSIRKALKIVIDFKK